MHYTTDVTQMASATTLRDVLLQAMLDDCRDGKGSDATDAVRLAVSWRDPEIVRSYLDSLSSGQTSSDGLVRALERALSAGDCPVVAELLKYTRPGPVRFAELIKEGSVLNVQVLRLGGSQSLERKTAWKLYQEYQQSEEKQEDKKTSTSELWKYACDWKTEKDHEYEVEKDALFGLSLLAWQLDWDFVSSPRLESRPCT